MICQVFGRPRRLPPGKVLGRSHDGHAHVRADPHRDHVFLDVLAETDTCVEALLDDVAQIIFGNNLYTGIRHDVLHDRRPRLIAIWLELHGPMMAPLRDSASSKARGRPRVPSPAFMIASTGVSSATRLSGLAHGTLADAPDHLPFHRVIRPQIGHCLAERQIVFDKRG